MDENKIIILAILVLSIIVCYKSTNSFLNIIFGGVLLICFFKYYNNSNVLSYLTKSPIVKEGKSERENIINNGINVVNNDNKKSVEKIKKDKFMNLDTNTDFIKKGNEIENLDNIFKQISEEIELIKSENTFSESNENKYKNYLGNIDNNEELENNTDISVLSGDEKIAYSHIMRNDPIRVLKGGQNEFKNLSKYIKEEIIETELRDWWGNHEY